MRQRFKRVVIAFDAREHGPPPRGGLLRPRTGPLESPPVRFGPSVWPPTTTVHPLRGAPLLRCRSVSHN